MAQVAIDLPAWLQASPAPGLPSCLPAWPTRPLPSWTAASAAVQFHLEQARSRSMQRLADGRPKPVDKLAHTIFLMEGETQEVGWGGQAAAPALQPVDQGRHAAALALEGPICLSRCRGLGVALTAHECKGGVLLACGAPHPAARAPPPPAAPQEPTSLIAALSLRQVKELVEDIKQFVVGRCAGGGTTQQAKHGAGS
jgi:hypothetical protein